MANDLHTFIAHARKKSMDHATIRMLLLSAGWKERDIAEALTEETLDMAVPVPPDAGGARDAFFHLLTFVALYTWVISTIILFFQYINILFPDAALQQYRDFVDYSGIRWSLAAVIVSFPLYAFLTRFLLKEMRVHPEKASSAIRRWLTYLTLFVAAAALMGDVITLVFYLLEGELSIRFILKVLVVLLLAGITFTYYLLSLKMPMGKPKTVTMHRTFGWVATAIILVSIVWGIILVGSPMSERERKFDDRRVENLRSINNEIHNITLDRKQIGGPTLKRGLPATLAEVQELATFERLEIVDPQTGAPYEYEVVSETDYRLCAAFNFVRAEQFDVFWDHPAGRHCYELDVLEDQF